ncbi:GTP-binding protein [Kocuria sp. cx-455]|nr:GTP-binding protein [Kocuria sp. cx-455]
MRSRATLATPTVSSGGTAPLPGTARIPVLILTGYLGAGKTTVLNRFLAASGARIGVIINDFGDVNVDAALVAGQVDEPVSVAGGCLCCISDPDQLDQAFKKLTRPDLSLDAIVIEGSGVAEPPALLRLVMDSRVPRVRFGGLIEVVDAVHVPEAEAAGWDLEQHVRAAAVVLLTKTDLATDPGSRQALERRIHRANPHAMIIEAPHGVFDPALFVDAGETEELEFGQLALWNPGETLGESHSKDGHSHHHVHHQSVTVEHDGTVDPVALSEFALDPPESVYRVKAIVDVATSSGPQRFAVHSVAGYVTVEAMARGQDEPLASSLVAIGLDLDRADLQTRLASVCLPPTTPPASAAQLRRLTRFRT